MGSNILKSLIMVICCTSGILWEKEHSLDLPIRHRVNSLLASVTNLSIKDWHRSHKWIGMLRILQMKQKAVSGLCRNSVNRLPLCCWSETDCWTRHNIRLHNAAPSVQGSIVIPCTCEAKMPTGHHHLDISGLSMTENPCSPSPIQENTYPEYIELRDEL